MTYIYILIQTYVIYARRKYSVAPPATSGPPAFERIFRAQANCSEYFPIFITALWTSGVFFSEGASALCGLFYLYGRLRYFWGYAQSPQGRLAPLYFSAQILWLLIGFSSLGVFFSFCRIYLNLDLVHMLCSVLGFV
uniref:Leukotriene C4 synthase n=1 Tax=Sphaeramia orbicularis TaxID=375764 RepID=A0A672ZIA7_9TELE